MESIKEFLRTLPLLSSLSDEEIELLARTCEERRFPAEAHILRKGEPGASAFILKEGAAETRLEKPTGAPLRLSKNRPRRVVWRDCTVRRPAQIRVRDYHPGQHRH